MSGASAWTGALGLALLLVGCGGDDVGEPTPPDPCVGVVDGDGRCVPAAVQDDGCLAGELGGEAGCEPAGVTEAWCAEGFAFDAEKRSCEPILPDAACPPGQMALPGETSCRPVMECPVEPWGGIPTDAATVHVDASYTGQSTGSATQPYPTIGEAVAAAAPGAIVAIEAGQYPESLILTKPLTLWGVCPERVVLAAAPGDIGVSALTGSAGSELRGLAIAGGLAGVATSDTQVVVDRVWIHDASDRCIGSEATFGPPTLVVRDSLVAGCRRGIVALGTTLTLDGLEVRDTVQSADPSSGWGVEIAAGPLGLPSDATIQRLVVRNAREAGLYILGSHATLEAAVFTAIQPALSPEPAGAAIILKEEGSLRGSLELRSSAILDNMTSGLFVQAADAVVEGVVIRDNRGTPASEGGRGIVVLDGLLGEPASLTARATSVLRNREVGIVGAGVDIELFGVLVRESTRAEDDSAHAGQGIAAYDDAMTGQAGTLTVIGSRIRDNLDQGVVVIGADLVLSGVDVGHTRPNALGLFGDGVAVVPSFTHGASAVVDASLLTDNARVGLAVFASVATAGRTHLRCNDIPIATEQLDGDDPDFVNAGDNVCGCDTPSPCKALSVGLAPPEALD